MMPIGFDSKDDDDPIIAPPTVHGRVSKYTISIPPNGLEIIISWDFHQGYIFQWTPSNSGSDQPMNFHFSGLEEAKAVATEILTAEYYVKAAHKAVQEKLNKALEKGIA